MSVSGIISICCHFVSNFNFGIHIHRLQNTHKHRHAVSPCYSSVSFNGNILHIVQCQIKKIDVGTIQSLFRFLQFYKHSFVCLVTCNFIHRFVQLTQDT